MFGGGGGGGDGGDDDGEVKRKKLMSLKQNTFYKKLFYTVRENCNEKDVHFFCSDFGKP